MAGAPALEPDRAQTPSERLAPSTPAAAPRVVATLDQAIGPKFSTDGDRFTATIQPGSILPAGGTIVGRIVSVQPAMAGTSSYAVLAVDGVQEPDGSVDRLDARIVGVELLEKQQGGREVSPTGPPTEVIGAVIPPEKLPRQDALDRDPLGKGTIIALGAGDQLHQLDAGARIAIELRGFGERLPVAGGGRLGQTVMLRGVPVVDVIGDVVFWVDNGGDRMLVVLDKLVDTPETRIIVKNGMSVDIEGVVETMPRAEEAPRLWKLVSAPEADAMRGEKTYIFATRARIK